MLGWLELITSPCSRWVTARRWPSVIPAQAAISSAVRRQPTQKRSVASKRQTPLQGEGVMPRNIGPGPASGKP